MPLPLMDTVTGATDQKIGPTTVFVTDQMTPDLTLPINKTWLYRYYSHNTIDGGDEPVPRCLVMLHYDGPNTPFSVGDFPCTAWVSANPLANVFTMCEFPSKSYYWIREYYMPKDKDTDILLLQIDQIYDRSAGDKEAYCI